MALNRAFLARQFLLERATMPAIDAVEHLIGLQSQAPNPPYVGLWTRLVGFRHDELSRLVIDREAVRIALMRSTIHLVGARDCLALRPLAQPVLERGFTSTYGRAVSGLDLSAVSAAGRALVEERPRTFAELGTALRERWPDRDGHALSQAVRTFVPLVQVPPRGLWGQGGQALHTSAEAWLGRRLEEQPSADALFRRYLAAFGPASVQDAQTWSGLTGLRAVAERLRPELLVFRDQQGRELFDLPDSPRPDPETPAPVRFLPEWDNVLLSHVDRTRIVSDDHRRRIFTANGMIPGTVLVDGSVAAIWKITRNRDGAALDVDPLTALGPPDRAAIVDEGERLLAFAAGGAVPLGVRFVTDE